MSNKQIIKTCSVTGLEIIEKDEWQNLQLNKNYLISFRKIGDHVVDIHGHGNFSEFNALKYQSLLDRFVETMDVKLPFVEMRNYEDISGIIPSRETLQMQKDYSIENADRRVGFITYNCSKALDLILVSAKRQYKNVPVAVKAVSDYKEAIGEALDILFNKEDIGQDLNTKKSHKIYQKDLQWLTEFSGRMLWEDDFLYEIDEVKIDKKHPLHGIVENLLLLRESMNNLQVNVRHMESVLEDEHKQFQAVIESVQSGIILTDTETQRVVDVNDAVCQMMSLSKEIIIGKKLDQILEFKENYWKVSSSNLYDTKVLGPDDIKIPVKYRALKVKIREKTYVLHNILDVSDERIQEEKLKRNKMQAQQMNNLTFNREKRIIEMKMEVNSLLKELKKPPKYKSVLSQQRKENEE